MFVAMTTGIRHTSRSNWVLACLASFVAILGTLIGGAPASALAVASTYDLPHCTYDLPVQLLTRHVAVLAIRGSPAGLGAASWRRSISFGGDVVAANTSGKAGASAVWPTMRGKP